MKKGIVFFVLLVSLFSSTAWAALAPPALDAIPLKNVNENDSIKVYISATVDAADTVVLSTSTLPSNCTLIDSGTLTPAVYGKGYLRFLPSYSQSGSYAINIFATSTATGGAGDKDTVGVSITVANINRKPVPVAVGTVGVLEGAALSVHTWATDADADAMTWAVKTGQLPSGAVFTDSGTGGGLFTWTPSYTQAGQYTPYFRVTDALSDKDSTQGTINVWNVSRAPVLYAVLTAKKTVAEGATLVDTIHSSDPDADAPLTITHSTLPSRLTHTDSIFTYAPNYTDSGHYSVDFFVADTTGAGALKDTISVIYTVTNVNVAPTLVSIGAKSVNENSALTFHPWSTDADADSIVYSYSGLPTGATFSDSGTGGGLFSWTPTWTQSGTWNIHILAYDKQGGVLIAVDSEIVTITVADAVPALDTIVDAKVDVGDSSVVHIYSTGADTMVLTLLTEMDNVSLTDSGTGGGIFKFVPDSTQYGTWRFIVEARGKYSGDIDTVGFNIDIRDSTDTLNHYVIMDPTGLGMWISENRGNGLRITGEAEDTSDWFDILSYTDFSTSYRMASVGTGDTSYARIYAQGATSLTYPFTVDSVTIAKNDTSSSITKNKTWTIPAVPYLRFITRGLLNNDTSQVYETHVLR